MIVLGLDPGYKQSAVVVFNGSTNLILDKGVESNEMLLETIQHYKDEKQVEILVIEQMQMFRSAFGVGVEVFDSQFWAGRFAQVWHPRRIDRIIRARVRSHLNAMKGGDAAVRQGLINRFGAYKEVAIGSKKQPGPLFGVKSHEWSALALAVTWHDQESAKAPEIRPGVREDF